MKRFGVLSLVLCLLLLIACEPEEEEGSLQIPTMTEQELVYNNAVAVRNAATLYCAQFECTTNQELTKADVEDFLSDFDWTIYDTAATNEVVAIGQSSDWLISLERTGTGDYEWPFDLDPVNYSANDVVVDIN